MNPEKEWFKDEERVKGALTVAALSANKEQRAIMGIGKEWWEEYGHSNYPFEDTYYESDMEEILTKQKKRDWEEFREMAEMEHKEALEKSLTYQNDSVRAYQNMLDLIDAKLKEL